MYTREENENIIIENQNELEIEWQEEDQIYPMDGIKVDKGFYTVFELKRRFDSKEKRIILDSEFQREDVWKSDRKSELIESVLMGLPLPIFYFNQDKYGKLIVVDGRQRLTALFEYMNDAYPLIRLKILPKLNGLYFSELSPHLAGRLEDYQIQAHVILPPTPERIKFDIFDRVNRGGMQLNKQEIRNALYQGEATRFLKRIVESDAFKKATGNAFANEKRMKDKYLITRFVSFLLYKCEMLEDDEGNIYVYHDDIDDLLGRGLDELNRLGRTESQKIEDLESIVIGALEKAFFYLGKDAFRLKQEGRRSPINMNVFETVMFMMAWIPAIEEEIRYRVQEEYQGLVNSDEFKDNIGNHRDSAAKLEWRLEKAIQIGDSLSNIIASEEVAYD
ncbi:MAG: DUF262 domain-containing protein [Lachnospiraceae bacterium]|nr:DUF262 domain-containing protein [Lachnospiraceae bacterium]MDE7418043.1 DUF262 domain-containing protein [Lachnospiraceae bacterium]